MRVEVCPCGVLAIDQEAILVSEIVDLAPSKSSIYEVPVLPTARECPGINCANSASTLS
jgi:hypothetical protein